MSSQSFELPLGAVVADGLAMGRMALAGMIDVALACGLAGLRPRPMTVRDWVDEVDANDDISGLAETERRPWSRKAWHGRTATLRSRHGPKGRRSTRRRWTRRGLEGDWRGILVPQGGRTPRGVGADDAACCQLWGR